MKWEVLWGLLFSLFSKVWQLSQQVSIKLELCFSLVLVLMQLPSSPQQPLPTTAHPTPRALAQGFSIWLHSGTAVAPPRELQKTPVSAWGPHHRPQNYPASSSHDCPQLAHLEVTSSFREPSRNHRPGQMPLPQQLSSYISLALLHRNPTSSWLHWTQLEPSAHRGRVLPTIFSNSVNGPWHPSRCKCQTPHWCSWQRLLTPSSPWHSRRHLAPSLKAFLLTVSSASLPWLPQLDQGPETISLQSQRVK